MLINIQCPKCSAQSGFSLNDATYQGPYRCWKCRELFTIRLENNVLKSCEPLSQEQFERQQKEREAREKFKQR